MTVVGIHCGHVVVVVGQANLADSTVGLSPLAFELTRCVTKFAGLVTADTAP